MIKKMNYLSSGGFKHHFGIKDGYLFNFSYEENECIIYKFPYDENIDNIDEAIEDIICCPGDFYIGYLKWNSQNKEINEENFHLFVNRAYELLKDGTFVN